MEIIEQLQFLVSQAIENRALKRSWGVFRDSGGILGRLSASWVRLGLNLKASESAIRCLGDVLEALWGILRGSWGVLGRPWRLPGIILEAFLKDFLAF